MINFCLRIKNPFYQLYLANHQDRRYPYGWVKEYLWGSKSLFGLKNKRFEYEVTRCPPEVLFSCVIDIEWSGHDHAGPSFEIEIFGWMLRVGIYDIRHWDDDTNTWEVYEEEEEVNV